MCLQFSVDNYLIQALGWALTEYGDSLQSQVATRLEKHSSVRDIVSKEVLNTLKWLFKTIFLSSHMYPENPEGTQVIVGSMNMGYDI